ncbi:MAG: hypothetical protein WCC22_18090, partial [Terriglobales bacterium]
FSTATICSTENRFLFTANLPSSGSRFCRKLTLIVCQKSGGRSAPSKTFTDLRRSAAWWAPFLITVIFSVAFVYVVDQKS